MRKIMFFLLLIPASLYAQICSDVFEKDSDKFSDDVFYKTRFYDINNGYSLGWRMYVNKPGAAKQEITISFVASKGELLRCTPTGSPITLLLEDNSKIQMFNILKTDCSGYFSISFYLYGKNASINKSRIKKLSKLKIKALRVKMEDRLWDYDFTEDQAYDVMRAFQCGIELVK